MSIFAASLFFEGGRIYGIEETDDPINEITFDLILEETHNLVSEVSQHGIEEGSEIADHVQNAIRQGNVRGLITNFSIQTFGFAYNRARDIYDTLVDLWERKVPLTIYTVLDIYDNIILNNIPITKESELGDGIEIQFSFQQIKLVKLQSIGLDIKISSLSTDIQKQIAKKSRALR